MGALTQSPHLNRTRSLIMAATAHMLPADISNAVLAGRLLLDEGPAPVVIRGGAIEDVSRSAQTIAALMDLPDPASVPGERLFGIDELERLPTGRILAPVDLQAVKAAGVTFAISAIERVIEERARGDFRLAGEIREKLEQRIGGAVRSGGPRGGPAARAQGALVEGRPWSRYLAVGAAPGAAALAHT